jgi:hypothetical protein
VELSANLYRVIHADRPCVNPTLILLKGLIRQPISDEHAEELGKTRSLSSN